jgi:hypothetical protein
MTPKEKAKELVDNLIDKMFDLSDGYNSSEVFYAAKQCALIAVDEIISCLDDDDLYIQGESNIDAYINYYKEVKAEIDNL